MRLAFVLLLVGCGGTARDTNAYRTDTQHLLETHTSQVKECYDEALKTDKAASGVVAIQFVIEKKTGELTKATVDPEKTTASQALGNCVLEAVKGLELAPPDKHEGHATFVYEFKPARTAS